MQGAEDEISSDEEAAPAEAQTTPRIGDLWYAAAKGRTQDVLELIAAKADLQQCGGSGFSPLHSATSHGHREVVALLLGAGADVQDGDRLGYSPLHVASGRGDTGVVGVLLGGGANIAAKTRVGWTPMVSCRRSPSLSISQVNPAPS
ncbi:ankyrin repeat-containing domain protein [Baffinella frigidus]|nr:ankyrin repeat-containing domain protein [Cryptophyta sp. CCMP2293]